MSGLYWHILLVGMDSRVVVAARLEATRSKNDLHFPPKSRTHHDCFTHVCDQIYLRDLRFIDQFSSGRYAGPTFLARRNCVIVNVGHVRAIVMRDPFATS